MTDSKCFLISCIKSKSRPLDSDKGYIDSLKSVCHLFFVTNLWQNYGKLWKTIIFHSQKGVRTHKDSSLAPDVQDLQAHPRHPPCQFPACFARQLPTSVLWAVLKTVLWAMSQPRHVVQKPGLHTFPFAIGCSNSLCQYGPHPPQHNCFISIAKL